MAASDSDRLPGLGRPALRRVLESAARLQEVLPDAVLVGGSAAALYAGHRESSDHDHVLADLADRFDAVLEAIEATDGWVTNRVEPGKVILGELGGIEAGVRQMRRKVPLEVDRVELPDGQSLRVPSLEEILRIKAYLLVRRNQARDYLDVAALAQRVGIDRAAAVLSQLDRYYADQRDAAAAGVATQVARQLADPRPKDSTVTGQLSRYKGLDPKWHNWRTVRQVVQEVARAMVT